jgi:hypothetical protein
MENCPPAVCLMEHRKNQNLCGKIERFMNVNLRTWLVQVVLFHFPLKWEYLVLASLKAAS